MEQETKIKKTSGNFQKPGSKLLIVCSIILFALVTLFMISFCCEAIISSIVGVIFKNSENIYKYHVSEIMSTIIVGIIMFYIGRWYFRNLKRDNISEFEKVLLIIIPINGFMIIVSIVIIFAGAEYGIIAIIYCTIASLFHICAFVLSIKRKFSPTYLLMIIGGILSLPLGIISILAGSGLKKFNDVSNNLGKLENPEGEWECPKCNKTNKNTTYKCDSCGYSLV